MTLEDVKEKNPEEKNLDDAGDLGDAGTLDGDLEDNKSKTEEIKEKAGKIKTELGETLADSLHAAKDMIMDEFKASKDKADAMDDGSHRNMMQKTEDFIKENPVKSVLIALAAGIVLGKVIK